MSVELNKLTFSSPVTHVYNPLDYAWDAHEWYVNKFGNSERKVLLVGMNPGTFRSCTKLPYAEILSDLLSYRTMGYGTDRRAVRRSEHSA